MPKLTQGKTVQSRNPKTEPVTHKANLGGVAQQGSATAFKKEPLTSGRGYEPAPMPATGSRGTFNSASQGPGSGRTVYGSGSQSPTPTAQEMPAGRDTLAEYGPEISGAGRRR